MAKYEEYRVTIDGEVRNDVVKCELIPLDQINECKPYTNHLVTNDYWSVEFANGNKVDFNFHRVELTVTIRDTEDKQ